MPFAGSWKNDSDSTENATTNEKLRQVTKEKEELAETLSKVTEEKRQVTKEKDELAETLNKVKEDFSKLAEENKRLQAQIAERSKTKKEKKPAKKKVPNAEAKA